jgi:hypothetical protein
VRKNISVQKGELVLFEDIKYFFYITNHTKYSVEQIVALANQHCDQENVLEQLKNGNGLRTQSAWLVPTSMVRSERTVLSNPEPRSATALTAMSGNKLIEEAIESRRR